MKSSPSDQPETLNRTQALQCIPTQNSTVQWQELENGEILFTYPLPLNRFFLAIHRRFSKNSTELPTKKLQLDQMGSFVWHLIDGNKTVKEIIRIFAKEYNVTSQEAETSVTSFLKTLGLRGFIAIS